MHNKMVDVRQIKWENMKSFGFFLRFMLIFSCVFFSEHIVYKTANIEVDKSFWQREKGKQKSVRNLFIKHNDV